MSLTLFPVRLSCECTTGPDPTASNCLDSDSVISQLRKSVRLLTGLIPTLFVFRLCVSFRPDLLVRAARHYEGAGQVLLRRVMMSSQRFISIGQGEVPPLEEWQEVECPARIDLAGESSENQSWRETLLKCSFELLYLSVYIL